MGILLGFYPSKLCIMPFGAYINFKIDMKNYNMKILKGTICSLKIKIKPTITIIDKIIFLNLFITTPPKLMIELYHTTLKYTTLKYTIIHNFFIISYNPNYFIH